MLQNLEGKPLNQVCSPVLLWCEDYFSLLINVGFNTLSLEAHLARYSCIVIYCKLLMQWKFHCY